jgi:NAD(P)-dependent dehydrogenase (short-subunit alcohol dehydrogenase family)
MTSPNAEEEGQRSADEMTETLRKEADYSTQWVASSSETSPRGSPTHQQRTRTNVSPPHSIPKISAHFCDVSSPTSVSDCIKGVIKAHGKIDTLVTSAGFTENYDAINYPYDRMQKLWGVNVDGTYLFATGVAKHLMERKAPGSIVFIGSMSGAIVNVPQPQAPYNAAKAAVRHLAASLAVEWASSGIRVNNISPGYMLTALYVPLLKSLKILDN